MGSFTFLVVVRPASRLPGTVEQVFGTHLVVVVIGAQTLVLPELIAIKDTVFEVGVLGLVVRLLALLLAAVGRADVGIVPALLILL